MKTVFLYMWLLTKPFYAIVGLIKTKKDKPAEKPI